jgi:branched-chain amino acid transport system ATP-binding protein
MRDFILETCGLTMRFGGLTAVKACNIQIPQGAIVGLIGPNGAGKTTCFNMVTGFYLPSEGHVFFQGHEITGLAPHQVCTAGIARTFQNIRLFSNETALQNVMIGAHLRQKTTWWHALFSTPGWYREEKAVRDKALRLLAEVELAEHAEEKATSLPYGAQRRLEIARALATDPTFLLLDEPAAGMNPQETEHLMAFIRDIRTRFNLTILLIEHDMKVVMGICERIWVLDYGETIAIGTPDEVRADLRVIEAYLGKEYIQHA